MFFFGGGEVGAGHQNLGSAQSTVGQGARGQLEQVGPNMAKTD